MATTIPWANTKAFQATPLVSFGVGTGQYMGQIQQYRDPDTATGALMWIQVEAAGHMVPLDEPPAAAAALKQLMNQIY
jgi:carboxypeptidase C (cathepsin A)